MPYQFFTLLKVGRRGAAALACALGLLASATPALALDDMALRAYPRAKEVGRYDNPLEAGNLPISPPERDAKGGRTSRWHLPYEGQVSIVQYRHEPDDSPLLIARHYAAQLKEQGFELLTICDAPCTAPDGVADSAVYWYHEIDLAKKLSLQPLGNRGLYLMAHRADAVAAVRVGGWDAFYGSTVKIVRAPGLDRAPLLAYVERTRAPVASASLPPALPPATRPPMAAAPGVLDIAPRELAAWIKNSKGWVVLQLTSLDPACGFCVRSNPGFAGLAKSEAGKGFQFVRVAFQPWTSVTGNEFVTAYSIGGIPTFITFQDGQVMRRRNGTGDEATLRQALLDGVR